MSASLWLKSLGLCGFLLLAFAVTASADQVYISPFVSCGGATTCNGATPFSLTSSDLTGLLPAFGGTPVQFAITNNSGATIDQLTLTLSGTLGSSSELWNSNTTGFNASTNPFTIAIIDGFDSLNGTPCTGGGVTLGTPLAGGTCNGGSLPATFVWSAGSSGVGIAPGQTFVLQYQSPVIGDRFASPVPEPATLTLLAGGLGLMGVMRRRNRQKEGRKA